MQTQTTSPSRSWHFWHPRADLGLYIGGLLLMFVLGVAAANGWATHNALQGQAVYFQKDCRHRVHSANVDGLKKGVDAGWTAAIATEGAVLVPIKKGN